MNYQLSLLTSLEAAIKRELASTNQVVNLSALGDWEEKARQYFEDLRAGMDSLNAAPQNDEERQEIFALKRQIVETLVQTIEIKKDRELKVNFRLNVLSLLGQTTDFSEIQPVETYSRIFDLTNLARVLVTLVV